MGCAVSFAWSFSSLSQFRNCPKQFHEVRILKNFVEEQGEHAAWGDRVHESFELALKTSTPLPMGMEVWQQVVDQFRGLPGVPSFELQLALDSGFRPCEWFGKNVWCRGIVDALWIDGDVARAVDWKTGKRKPNSDQLALFALLVFHHYPQVQTVRTMFVWLKTFQQDQDTFTRDQIPMLWQKFVPDLRRLEAAHQQNTWPARTSGLCNAHCPVVTCSFNGKRRHWSP